MNTSTIDILERAERAERSARASSDRITDQTSDLLDHKDTAALIKRDIANTRAELTLAAEGKTESQREAWVRVQVDEREEANLAWLAQVESEAARYQRDIDLDERRFKLEVEMLRFYTALVGGGK